MVGEAPTAEEIEAQKSQVKVQSESGAKRVVESLCMTGHIATYYEETEPL